MGQGEQRLWLYLLHSSTGHQRQAGVNMQYTYTKYICIPPLSLSDVGQGEQRLWVHFLYSSTGNKRQAGARGGQAGRGRALRQGCLRQRVEAVATGALGRTALPSRALARARTPSVQGAVPTELTLTHTGLTLTL